MTKSSSEEEEEIERELADVTFEELQRARYDGSDLVYRKPKPEKNGGRANKCLYKFQFPVMNADVEFQGFYVFNPDQDKELKSVATKRTEKDILAEHMKKEGEAAKKGKQPI